MGDGVMVGRQMTTGEITSRGLAQLVSQGAQFLVRFTQGLDVFHLANQAVAFAATFGQALGEEVDRPGCRGRRSYSCASGYRMRPSCCSAATWRRRRSS